MPDTEATTKPVLHLRYLDSVRGIAALMVVIYHFINWDYKEKLYMQVTSIVFNGADAVSFFFVLSGFVLSYKYLVLKHELDIRKFYINRFFRLWPAFFVTVIINALYHQREFMSVQRLLEVFVYNKHRFWEEAALIRPASLYYVPGWTLVVELVVSFFVPFVVVLAHKNPKYVWWLAGFFFFFASGIIGLGMFINHFVYGVLIAAYYLFITSDKFKETKIFKFRYLVLAAAFILFSARQIEYIFGAHWFYDEVIYKYLGYDVYYFTGIGSFIMLVFIIQSRSAQKLLEHRILRFFGKISYGIYLMHWLVVTWIFVNRQWLSSYFPNEKTAFVCLLVACLVVTILLAYITYHAIELPFIKYGKRLTSRMKPSIIVAPEEPKG